MQYGILHQLRVAIIGGVIGMVCVAGPTYAEPLNVYSIGNSLTVDLRANGGVEFLGRGELRGTVHDYHARCGSSLTGIRANLQETCVPPLYFGRFSDAFALNASHLIDVVTLQPFYGATIRQEVAAAQAMLRDVRATSAGQNARVLLFATWPSQADGSLTQAWEAQGVTLDSPFRPSRAAYDLFLAALRETEPTAGIIPAGHAWVSVAEASGQGAFGGISGVTDLYRDDIHASNLGRYVSGLVAYSVLYNKDPSGLGLSWMYNLSGYGVAPLAADLAAIEDIVWTTVMTVPEPRATWPWCGLATVCLLWPYILVSWQRFRAGHGLLNGAIANLTKIGR